jgi:hypothetical protein
MERESIEDKPRSALCGQLGRVASARTFGSIDRGLPSVEPLEARILMSASASALSTLSASVSPAIVLDAAPLQYAEKQGAAPIDGGLTLSSGATSLTSASVRLLGYVQGEDVLSVAPQNGISFWWDSSSGVMYLNGEATADAYQAVLRSITYTDASYDPSTAPRIAQVTVTDAQFASGTASRSITISAANDPPSVQTPPIQTTAAGSQLIFSSAGGNAIIVSDVDANGAVEQVSLVANDGTLRLAEEAGLSFTAGAGLDDAMMTFEGTLDSIDAALNGLTFTPTSNVSPAASLEVAADDLGNSGVGGAQIVNALIPIVVTGVIAAPPTVGDLNPPPPNPRPSSGPTQSLKAPTPVAPVLVSVPIPVTELAAAANVSRSYDLAPSDSAQTSAQVAAFSSSLSVVPDDESIGDIYGAAARDGASTQRGQPSIHPSSTHQSEPQAPLCLGISADASGGQTFFSARPLGMDSMQTPFQVAEQNATAPTRPARSFLPLEQRHARNVSRVVSNDLRALPLPFVPIRSMLRELDAIRRRISSDLKLRFWAGSASILSAGASLAYLLWVVRGGSLLSSLLSSIPAWKLVDPLPILDHLGKTAAMLRRDKDDGLETLIRDARGK